MTRSELHEPEPAQRQVLGCFSIPLGWLSVFLLLVLNRERTSLAALWMIVFGVMVFTCGVLLGRGMGQKGLAAGAGGVILVVSFVAVVFGGFEEFVEILGMLIVTAGSWWLAELCWEHAWRNLNGSAGQQSLLVRVVFHFLLFTFFLFSAVLALRFSGQLEW